MASNTICTPCLQALRHGGKREARTLSNRRSIIPRRSGNGSRPFSSTPFSQVRMTIEDIREQNPTGTSPTARTNSAADDASAMQKFAQRLRSQKQMKSATEPYVAYGATEDLFRACAKAGEYTMPNLESGQEPVRTAKGEDLGVGEGWWYQELKLNATFNTWAQITFLHMYLLTARLRQLPADHAPTWHQNLLDHFFYAAEDRMAVYHNMAARSVRNRYLKDLFVQWRGVLTAYDEGLIRGDAVLGTAVWRNLFGADEKADMEHVAQVVAWFRRNLKQLDGMADADLATGDVKFVEPSRVLGIVGKESKMLKTPFSEADLAGASQLQKE